MFQLNVVVHEDGHAALCDFGLSRLIAATEEEGVNAPPSQRLMGLPSTGFTATSFGGTLRYLAPELMSGDDGPTIKTDVYAFACTCAEVHISSAAFCVLTYNTHLYTNLPPRFLQATSPLRLSKTAHVPNLNL